MKPLMIPILTMTLMSPGLALAGNENGNGGDPLRDLFNDGRGHAAARVLSLQPCSFQATVRGEVREWVIANKQALATDILESRHGWITDPQATCAFTRTYPRADVTLSFQACGMRVKDMADAGRVLVHESVHHFGFSDEIFPDEVAAAVYLAEPTTSCPQPPADDPFDPASCPGAPLTQGELKALIPLPEAPQRELGRFSVHTRMRTCYAPQLCTGWKDADRWAFYFNSGRPGTASREGVVKAELISNQAYLTFTSDVFKPYTGDASLAHYYLWGQLRGTTLTEVSRGSVINSVQHPHISVHTVGFAKAPTGTLTRSCARLVAEGMARGRDSNGNDIFNEYEVVFLSRFQ